MWSGESMVRSPVYLGPCYAMSGTDIAYGAPLSAGRTGIWCYGMAAYSDTSEESHSTDAGYCGTSGEPLSTSIDVGCAGTSQGPHVLRRERRQRNGKRAPR
eukprot:3364151-Rhodomonas_salina.1